MPVFGIMRWRLQNAARCCLVGLVPRNAADNSERQMSRVLLGMLTPSSNTVLEPVTSAMISGRASGISSRSITAARSDIGHSNRS